MGSIPQNIGRENPAPQNGSIIEVPFLKSIGLFLTYKCQVACKHCLVNAGPNRTEEISQTDLVDWITQISAYNDGHIKLLTLTGGEPFFNREKLKGITRMAHTCGMSVSAVTNAYWASTENEAIGTLEDVPEIDFLAFSTDSYHQEAIPLENVKNAIKAAEKRNILYAINVCTDSLNDKKYLALVDELRKSTEEMNIQTSVIYQVGRAGSGIIRPDLEYSEDPPISACKMAASPLIFPDGSVKACAGPIIALYGDHQLLLGNLRAEKLSAILDRSEINPILHALRVWGPRKIFEHLKELGYGDILPKAFLKGNVCEACIGLIANPSIRDHLDNLNNDKNFIIKVAYARAYYLNETRMIELLGLHTD